MLCCMLLGYNPCALYNGLSYDHWLINKQMHAVLARRKIRLTTPEVRAMATLKA